MSKYTDDELYQLLTETGRLLQGVKPREGEEYSLDAILAEFGQETAKPAPKGEEPPAQRPAEQKIEPEPETAPAEQEKPKKPVEDPALLDTGRLRSTVAANMAKVMGPEKKMDGSPVIPGKKEKPAPAEKPVLRVVEGGKADPEQDKASDIFPEEPEGMHKVPLEQVMSQTVEAVLDEDDAILEPSSPLLERVQNLLEDWGDKLSELLAKRRESKKASRVDEDENEPAREEPEPEMEQAAREEKRICKKLHRHVMWSAVPALLVVGVTAADAFGILSGLWEKAFWLHNAVLGGLLLITVLLAVPMWREMVMRLKSGRSGCELGAGVAAVVTLADCAYGALHQGGAFAPFAAPAAVMVWLCQLGMLLRADARWSAFHLADIGGAPPYGAGITAAGTCKQKGTIRGFYNTAYRDAPPRRWQNVLVPLFLAAATVLSAVVVLSRKDSAGFLWVWSALLVAGIPLAMPLTDTLPLKYLIRRLVKSGSAVAGYEGARTVCGSRRMVVTDDDLFPPGTVGLNGLKVYGEEIGKVVSYAASIAQACHSQLTPLFDQLLMAEGGLHLTVEDLHYFEEGGVGGTIHGESVTMGSAYFMRKSRVTLPQELKLKTGVFLAVDGTLIAIFAIKYQPSRNVEWALRAMRRNRIVPVLAVRSCNVTPGLVKRKFNLDARALYPDVSTRLALSDLSRETAEQSGAIIYRDGLMPFAETAVGSRRMIRSSRAASVLAYLGGLCGLLLAYYFTGAGAPELLDPVRMLVFQGLWLLPTLLLSGTVKHY